MTDKEHSTQARPEPGTPVSGSVTVVPCLKPGGTPRDHPATGLDAGELFAFRKHQALLRRQLNRPLLTLFHELTGLCINAFWPTPLGLLRPDKPSLACPIARQNARPGKDAPARCQRCQRHHWRTDRAPSSRVRRFKGECGITNFVAAVHAGPGFPLRLVVQSRVADTDSPARAGALDRAAALLGLIRHDLQATVGGETAQGKLEDCEREIAHLRAELRERIPVIPALPASPTPGSHAQHLVQAMLDYLRAHSTRPICLNAMATDLRSSPAYLSRLFSSHVGVTFHQYLDELRLTRARELLRDPANRLAEVAAAAGYASADYFRHAFKAHAGVAPSAWRQGR